MQEVDFAETFLPVGMNFTAHLLQSNNRFHYDGDVLNVSRM
jgi:hypothetical protein